MAIVIEANYSKKLGLPQYSSHQYSITLRTEIADLTQLQGESDRLYKLLQQSVDTSIKEVGFLPGEGGSVPIHQRNSNGNGHNDDWECSEKQKNLILKIVEENKLDKKEIEALAQDRFGKGVTALNKLEASSLIEELLEQYGGAKGNGHRFTPRYQRSSAK